MMRPPMNPGMVSSMYMGGPAGEPFHVQQASLDSQAQAAAVAFDPSHAKNWFQHTVCNSRPVMMICNRFKTTPADLLILVMITTVVVLRNGMWIVGNTIDAIGIVYPIYQSAQTISDVFSAPPSATQVDCAKLLRWLQYWMLYTVAYYVRLVKPEPDDVLLLSIVRAVIIIALMLFSDFVYHHVLKAGRFVRTYLYVVKQGESGHQPSRDLPLNAHRVVRSSESLSRGGRGLVNPASSLATPPLPGSLSSPSPSVRQSGSRDRNQGTPSFGSHLVNNVVLPSLPPSLPILSGTGESSRDNVKTAMQTIGEQPDDEEDMDNDDEEDEYDE